MSQPTSFSKESNMASEGKWTPGPWLVQDGTTSGKVVVAPDAPKVRRNMAACGGDRRDANARLIAAAPELADALGSVLVALESYRTDSDYFPDFPEWESAARAALAKARGEA